MPSNEELYLMASLFRSNNIDMDEIDDPFLYMRENLLDMINDNAINDAYGRILSASKYNENTNDIIMFLIRNYVMTHERNDQVNRYFCTANYDDALLFFMENEHFGKSLINSYFTTLLREQNYYDENKDLFYKFMPVMLVGFLPNELRCAFRRFYGVLQNAINPYYSGSKIFEMILNRQAEIECSDEMKRDERFLKGNKNYLLRLMFSDVYADLIENNLLDNYNQKIVQAVKYAINNNDYALPMEDNEIDALFKYFFELCNDAQRRQTSINNLIRRNNNVYKDINPLWKIDKDDILVKR